MYRLILILITLGIANASFAQTEKGFSYYEQTTLRHYEAGEWAALIPVGKEALKQDWDYYYLRMRLGIAYYQLGQYRLAIPHFRQALHFSERDPVAGEYLYYALLFSGQDMEAEWLRWKLQLKPEGGKPVPAFRLLRGFQLEGGIRLSDQATDMGHMESGFVGLEHQLHPRLRLFHGYQRLGQAVLDTVSGQTGQGPGPGRPWESVVREIWVQDEYYARLALQLGHGWQGQAAYHGIWFPLEEETAYDRLFHLALSKDLTRMRGKVGVSWIQIEDQPSQQYSFALRLFPLANNQLYLEGGYNLVQEAGKLRSVYQPQIGGQIADKIWWEAFYTHGDLRHLQEGDGLVFYNLNDEISSRWGVNLTRALGAKDYLSVYFRWENKRRAESRTPYRHWGIYLGYAHYL